MPRNYDRERARKSNRRINVLGQWWFLIVLWLAYAYVMSFVANWLATGTKATIRWFHLNGYGILDAKLKYVSILKKGWSLSNWQNAKIMYTSPTIYWPILAVLSLLVVGILLKTWRKYRDTSHNQYGNDRLTSEHEIMRQYPQIPDRGKTFPGYGGMPVHHAKPTSLGLIETHPIKYFRDYLLPRSLQATRKIPVIGDKLGHGDQPANGFYAIDQTTVNSLIVGITRSGKGETLVMPLVDILSRAKKKSSMILNDPKGELYQMSYDTLRKRGYNVQVLNIQKTDFSMSYNPLQNIINYAKAGYYDEVQQEVNTLSSSIYVDPNAKDKFWQNSSINLLNSLILAIIDYAKRNDRWEMVTMDNVVHMMTNLGSQQVGVNEAGDIVKSPEEAAEAGEEYDPSDPAYQVVAQKPKLIVYFEKLDEVNKENPGQFRQMAHDAFAQSKFAGDETSGNIYSSAMEGIKIYQQSNIAKMTSLNSVNFESIGFPRMFKVTLPDVYRFHTAVVTFGTTDGKKIESRSQLVDSIGVLSYAIKEKLPDNFSIKISFDFHKNPDDILQDSLTLSGLKQYERSGFGKSAYKKDPFTHQPILSDVKLQIVEDGLKEPPKTMQLDYSESPVALFMVTPPNNPSYNQLPAFAIDQIFNTIYNVALNNGRKAFNRVHFILDEFGNLPPIDHMDTKVSIGLGQNLLFDIVVQNLEQLKINYSADQAATIESNCANLLYILTESKDTAKSISERIEKQTVRVDTQSGQSLKMSSVNVSTQYMSQDILSPVELMQFQGGEMAVLRSVYRQDQKGHSVSAKPIFDHGKSEMPYRYTFLTEEFNDKNTLSDIGIKALHQNLDLMDLRIDYDEAYDQLIGLKPDKLPPRSEPSIAGHTASLASQQEIRNPSSPGGQLDGLIDSPKPQDTMKPLPDFKDYREPDMSDLGGSNLNEVFTDSELANSRLMSDSMQILGSALSQLSPAEYEAIQIQYLFDDMPNWWQHARHNDWQVIQGMFRGHEGLFEVFQHDLATEKERMEEGVA